MISPGRQAIFIFFSLILLSVQELESKDGISVQELEFKDRSERNGRLAKEGSDGVRHKNNVNKNQKENNNKENNNKNKNQKEERGKKAQKQHLAESQLGMKSENRKRNIKAEKTRNMRKLGRNMRKKNRKSSPKPRYDRLMKCIMILDLT